MATPNTTEFFNPKFMDQMFDTMNVGFKTAFEAGRTAQDTMQKTFTNMFSSQDNMSNMFSNTERLTQEFLPMVRKNMDIATESFEQTSKAGKDFFATAIDSMNASNELPVQDRSRKLFDAAFAMFRTTTDAAVKSNTKMMENFSEFVSCAACCTNGQTKAAPAPVQGPKATK